MKIGNIRKNELQKISEIDKNFYEGYQTPLEVLENWFENFSEGFLVAEENNDIVGYIFVELFDKIKTVPLFEIVGELLLEEIIKFGKCRKCKAIIWVTGEKIKHDIYEKHLIEKLGFAKREKIEKWESHPNHFVSGHSLWVKNL